MTQQNFSDSDNPVFQKWKWMIPNEEEDDDKDEK